MDTSETEVHKNMGPPRNIPVKVDTKDTISKANVHYVASFSSKLPLPILQLQ